MLKLFSQLLSRWMLVFGFILLTIGCGQTVPNNSSIHAKVDNSEKEPMIISLLAQAATMHFEDYNPSYVIQAVNALQPLGKEPALKQIEAYLEKRESSQDYYGLFWVLRVLFSVPISLGFPPVRIGQPSISPPMTLSKLPRFPIVMVRDIPFLVIRGYDLGGLPEPVEAHVAYFQAHGTLRKQPLAPPASMDGVVEEFMQLWKAAYGDAYVAEVLETIKKQIARYQAQHW